MSEDDLLHPGTEHLTPPEAMRLLAAERVSRLATDVGGEVDIFPINHRVIDGVIVFRTSPGTLLSSALVSRTVALESDGLDDQGRAWSVVVKGKCSRVETSDEAELLERIGPNPWQRGDKNAFVRIDVRQITGRRFQAS